jgi:hypothetical protein
MCQHKLWACVDVTNARHHRLSSSILSVRLGSKYSGKLLREHNQSFNKSLVEDYFRYSAKCNTITVSYTLGQYFWEALFDAKSFFFLETGIVNGGINIFIIAKAHYFRCILNIIDHVYVVHDPAMNAYGCLDLCALQPLHTFKAKKGHYFQIKHVIAQVHLSIAFVQFFVVLCITVCQFWYICSRKI